MSNKIDKLLRKIKKRNRRLAKFDTGDILRPKRFSNKMDIIVLDVNTTHYNLYNKDKGKIWLPIVQVNDKCIKIKQLDPAVLAVLYK